jgi:preprotein translocase subunit SecG
LRVWHWFWYIKKPFSLMEVRSTENIMQALVSFLYVIEVIVCLLLGAVVLLQKPKEGGLGVSFGGGTAEALFGAQTGNVLVNITIILGTVFLLNTIVLSRLTSSGADSVMENVRTAPAAAQQPALPFSGGATAPAPATTPVEATTPITPAPVAPAPASK